MCPIDQISSVRKPAVAGQFYPRDPLELRRQVEEFLRQAAPGADPPRAIIAPHAGYIYSGAVAACAYTSLRSVAASIDRVVLAGPSHFVAFRGLALSSAKSFETPLGLIELDRKACDRLAQMGQVSVSDMAHMHEHSLEVQLPFLQTVLGRFTLVPLVIGDATPEEVCEVFEQLVEKKTLFVISSDLSHYHNYRTARDLDAETSCAIENLNYSFIGPERACGCRPVNGLLLFAQRHALHALRLDLRNSGDTAGDRDRVVGYGAYAFID